LNGCLAFVLYKDTALLLYDQEHPLLSEAAISCCIFGRMSLLLNEWNVLEDFSLQKIKPVEFPSVIPLRGIWQENDVIY